MVNEFAVNQEPVLKQPDERVEVPEVEMGYEVPVPKQGYRIDKERAKFLWIKDESVPEIRSIKERIIDATERISFEEFREALKKTTEAFNQSRGQNTEPYAVLFDYKSHSSRRWVFELSKVDLVAPPQVARYFGPAGEKLHGYKLLEQNIQEGIREFAIFDDAIYSGEQVFRRTVKPIAEYFQAKGYEPPTFNLVVPFVTNRALDGFKEVADHYGVKINFFHQKVMPSMREIMGPVGVDVLQKRNYMLDVQSGEQAYIDATVTYFDHRMADNHSFSEEVRKLAGVEIPKPYADETTDYYKNEEEDFQEYQKDVGF